MNTMTVRVRSQSPTFAPRGTARAYIEGLRRNKTVARVCGESTMLIEENGETYGSLQIVRSFLYHINDIPPPPG
jgi:hypothetical protein